MSKKKFDQPSFFRALANVVPREINLVSHVAAILNVDESNAYRRINGIKPLTVDEMFLLVRGTARINRSKTHLMQVVDEAVYGVLFGA